MSYESKIRSLVKPSFSSIRKIAIDEISHLSEFETGKLWSELSRGVALLNTHEHLCQYLWSFGNMHQAKLLDAFEKLPSQIFTNAFEIIDWGCGQALGTINLIEYLDKLDAVGNIKKITLIEPSKIALERGKLHVSALVNDSVEILTRPDFFENIFPEDLVVSSDRIVIHIFSNILDVVQIDLKHLAQLIDSSVVSDNYLVCVGPLNPTNKRIDAFFRYFDDELIKDIYQYENSNFLNKNWTYKARIYSLEKNQRGHLIPIEYYPTVQFHSAYELDILKTYRRQNNINFNESLSHFEVAAPFDLGASVYDDVHPVLAVLNNIICRGLPTKTTVYVEEKFREAFDLTEKTIEYGEIKYVLKNKFDFIKCLDVFNLHLDKENKLNEIDKLNLQLLLTPVAISRFQKVLLEAIITGHISLKSNRWRILVEEKDIPFAQLALDDFKNTFSHLIELTKDFDDFILPEIELYIVSNNYFFNSKLQAGKVYNGVTDELKSIEFDLVITHAILKSASINIESFSEFKVKNKCYFNIRSIVSKRSDRVIYTSKLLKYKKLVDKNSQGVFIENELSTKQLTYFLQLFFRKESFRAGQLPILDRALQNLPVIGLLPTGGGKSLTYQISALLQPGVTMVIDPLKSLMKDQYDGLINSGIDFTAYINSSLTSQEKKETEKKLESSQLLFVFLSPERLSIASFRERLKNMHDYNVYFSYGVIDEVHCVSEWGHDFRFSYLHLGRNLYNYVRAKENEISLFGLTATASFDVLADVERELSGNGAFVLDADVIIRYENTNRLELQYKIEKVPVDFEIDIFYDQNNNIAQHLPKAINITNHWPLFDSKSNYLKKFIKEVPVYLNQLQEKENIKYIKERFIERQNNDEGINIVLETNISNNYYLEKDIYNEAGIVFCPHVDKTGLSVNKNTSNLLLEGVKDVASFSGRDNDNISMKNLEIFRNNESPLMVATKAFGMGIDKPNVRFTVNMNYSSSLESFVQESGRAGRDKKIALSTILVSDYSLVQISRKYTASSFPLVILKNKWFKEKDLYEILNYYNIEVPKEFLLFANPSNDIVKLHCIQDNRMFGFNQCNDTCSEFKKCTLKNVSFESKGWKPQSELIQELKSQNLNISKKNFQYLNADYQTVMYFFNEAFKGDVVEKKFMNQLLNTSEVYVGLGLMNIETKKAKGFLSSLLNSELNTEIVVFIPYLDDDSIDLSKAIYRMTCIELIEDFTQDYSNKQFRIVTRLKEEGAYYSGLKRFLLRYYTEDRANLEIEKVRNYIIRAENIDNISEEIYKCLAYLTEFVYDKISEKRKRAIDDIRNFCMEGLSENITWFEKNESLKDFIYYYFNSKYAKSDYIADNGESFSLVEDTDGGKKSNENILFKYIRVIDDDIVGVGTPLDNVKHLYGAVRLISRSLTDSNPALFLLEVFCLAYMGTKKNKNLEEQLILRYSEGMIEFSNRSNSQNSFRAFYDAFNEILNAYINNKMLDNLKEETSLLIHVGHFNLIKNKYLETNE